MIYAHLHDETWHQSQHTPDEERRHYQAVDRAVERDRGKLNLIGSLFWDAVPDAVVMLPEAVHRQRVAKRDDLEWGRVEGIRRTVQQMAAAHRVPVVKGFEELEASGVYHRDMGSGAWYRRVYRGGGGGVN